MLSQSDAPNLWTPRNGDLKTPLRPRSRSEVFKSDSSLFVRLSHRRCADLLEYFQQIQFVPVFYELPVLDAPDVDTPHLNCCTIGPVAHEWLAKGSVVGEAGADAIARFDQVLHHNFRVGKCVEVVPKECFNARRTGLYVCVVVVVLRMDELIEEFNTFVVQRLREEPWEMFVAH